ncbi:MAG: beta-lactamase family protein [Negativicutes bacterium]|nr:beta-lactamase family protein [Negativicutes bacterium]
MSEIYPAAGEQTLPFLRSGLQPAEMEARLGRAFALSDRAVAEGVAPGAALAVGTQDQVVFHCSGSTTKLDQGGAVEIDTLYDMASISKLFTSFMALKLLEQGAFRLDDPVSLFIAEFQRPDKRMIRMRHLLTHTSGLLPHDNFFLTCGSQQEMLNAIAVSPLQTAPGDQVAYSCLGYIALGNALQRIAGQTLPEFLERELFQPLGLQETGYNPQVSKNRIAPTEYCSWQKGKLCWGEVHDENARCQGGVSGNAGIFSSARDMASFAQMWMGEGSFRNKRLLSPNTVRTSILNYTAAIGEEYRGLGWLLKAPTYSFMGDLASPASFGHTGFTGTSIVLNPRSGLFVIWLTNRVHPSRREDRHIRYRALIHNAVFAALS